MSRKWWLAVQERFPKALNNAIKYFEERYGEKWRDEFKKNAVLIEYFKSIQITIEIYHTYNHEGHDRFKYKVRGCGRAIYCEPIFKTRYKAEQEAIGFAFSLEEKYLNRPKPKIIYRRNPMPRKQKGEKNEANVLKRLEERWKKEDETGLSDWNEY